MSRDPAPAGPSAVRATVAMPVDWQNRAVPAAQAVRAVRPGHRVFVGSACATPRRLLEALEALAPVGVELIHFLTDGAVGGRDGRPASHFRHRAFYIGRDMRELAEQQHVDYVPIALADVPRLIESGRLVFDVALVQASPPDERGMCSLGVTEYGTAYLFDRSLAERALALIEIAHPRHREGLLAAAIASGLLQQGQTLRSRGAYPVEEVCAPR